MTPGLVNRILGDIFNNLLLSNQTFATADDAFACLMELFIDEVPTNNKKTIMFASKQARILAPKLYKQKCI